MNLNLNHELTTIINHGLNTELNHELNTELNHELNTELNHELNTELNQEFKSAIIHERKTIRVEPIDKLILEYDQWYKLAYKKHKLQIKDILKLKPGDTLDLLIFDDNWKKKILISSFEKEKNKIYSPSDFFEYNFGTYIHSYGLTGILILHEMDIDVLVEQFEFYVESDDHTWNLLDDVHWCYLPINTGIGYKGPMIQTSSLNILPNVIVQLPHHTTHKITI